jgi:protein-tyrosine phosphatase
MRILFVCMGNICRSPTAEGVMRRLVEDAGLDIEIDSAGTGAWHAGEPPDRRATLAARSRGITLEGAARQVTADDFRRFDLLIALDRANLRELLAVAPDQEAAEKVRLLREFDPGAGGDLDVPDPYYGADRGFETVLDMVEAACRGLIDELRAAEKV